MLTQVRRASDETTVADAVTILRRGGLVAFPTETVYGLGADALNPEAVERVFEAKGRPADNPLIVHVASAKQARRFAADLPESARTLMEKFWPGPLTVVVERNDLVPDLVTAGLDTVAIRVPRHPVTLALLEAFDGGIVGPSANTSGRPSPTRAEHVVHDLAGRIDFVIDGGPTVIGLESTVVDCTVAPPAILRKGALTREALEQAIGPLQRPDSNGMSRSPGTRHRHYAPRARVVLTPPEDPERFAAVLKECADRRQTIGLLVHSPALKSLRGSVRTTAVTGSEDLARQLFQALREFDAAGVDTIIVEAVEETGIGATIMDRLRRAAEERTE